MIQKLSDIWEKWSTIGIKVPFVSDPLRKEPSVTLLFSVVTFILTIISLIALHIQLNLVIATLTTIMTWIIATVFYLIRDIQKAKVDLDDRSIELENTNQDKDSK